MCFCMKRQTRMIWLLIMFVSIFVFVSFHASCETVVGDPEERTNAGQIECGGRVYRPRRRISTVLLIGTDKNMDEKQDTSIGAYRNAGQADFLLLCVIDDTTDLSAQYVEMYMGETKLADWSVSEATIPSNKTRIPTPIRRIRRAFTP